MSTPGPWKVDTWEYTARESGRKEEIVIVSETLRIAVLDHGDKDWEECPFTVSYKEAEENAKLIASAPLLAERVRILRDVANQVVLEDEQNPGRIPSDIVTGARAALKATKEGA